MYAGYVITCFDSLSKNTSEPFATWFVNTVTVVVVVATISE
jgi:hypothetical protein